METNEQQMGEVTLPQPAPKKSKVAWLVLAGLVIVGLGIATGIYLQNRTFNSQVDAGKQDEQPADPSELKIAWHAKKTVESLKLIRADIENNKEYYNVEYSLVGKVEAGKYKGWDFMVVSAPCEGPCFFTPFIRGVVQGDKFVAFPKYSTVWDFNFEEGADYNYYTRKIETDNEVVVEDLEYPEYLAGVHERAMLKKEPNTDGWFSAAGYRTAFVNSRYGQVYTDDPSGEGVKRHGFYLRAPDGTVRVYSMKPDFYEREMPVVYWNDGSRNSTNYIFTDIGGCGAANYISVVTGLNIESDLEVAGTNNKGDKIYVLKNKEHELLKKTFEVAHYSASEGREVSYQEFTAGRPLFFWVDLFGRLIKFTNSNFLPQAECGKPVIYLYPEQEQKIRVEVEPKGGMTVSIPEYNGGWDVIAKPNGELVQINSGEKFPYLFWEGRGGIYEQPQKGFVVAKSDVYDFLVDKLSQYKLNQQEIADFIEFWHPRMQSSPYYFVTFLGTNSMNELAPLTITPQPDTVIRVLMDFTPLQKPIEVEGYEIRAPERKGFTVIEWGGVIRN